MDGDGEEGEGDEGERGKRVRLALGHNELGTERRKEGRGRRRRTGCARVVVVEADRERQEEGRRQRLGLTTAAAGRKRVGFGREKRVEGRALTKSWKDKCRRSSFLEPSRSFLWL